MPEAATYMPLQDAVLLSTVDTAIAYFQAQPADRVYNVADAYNCAVQQFFADKVGAPEWCLACSISFVIRKYTPETDVWADDFNFPEGYWATKMQKVLLHDSDYPGYYHSMATIVQVLEAIRDGIR